MPLAAPQCQHCHSSHTLVDTLQIARPAASGWSLTPQTPLTPSGADTGTRSARRRLPTPLHAARLQFAGLYPMPPYRSASRRPPLAGCHIPAALALPALPSPQESASTHTMFSVIARVATPWPEAHRAYTRESGTLKHGDQHSHDATRLLPSHIMLGLPELNAAPLIHKALG